MYIYDRVIRSTYWARRLVVPTDRRKMLRVLLHGVRQGGACITRTRWKSGSGGQDLGALGNTEATGDTSSRVVVSHDGSVAGGLVHRIMRWVGMWAESQVSFDNSDLGAHPGLQPSAVPVSVYPSPVAYGLRVLRSLLWWGEACAQTSEMEVVAEQRGHLASASKSARLAVRGEEEKPRAPCRRGRARRWSGPGGGWPCRRSIACCVRGCERACPEVGGPGHRVCGERLIESTTL